jgi:hypothetical protein
MTRAGAIASGFLLAVLLTLLGAEVGAQEGAIQAGYVGLPLKANPAGDGGLVVGEGSRLHAGVGAEMGYDSNIFYQPNGALSSPILRVLPFLDLTNQQSSQNAQPLSVGVVYDLQATLLYRHLFSDDARIDASNIRDTFSPSVSGLLDLSPNQRLGLTISDSFNRSEEAPYTPGRAEIIRNSNLAAAQVHWSPGGGRIQGTLRYSNRVDLYEGDYRLDRNMDNEAMFDLSWRWFPKTALYVNVTQGFIRYLDDSQTNRDSNPLRAKAGIRGLITEKLSAGVSAGYGNGFYRDGTNPEGFGNLSVSADTVWRPTFLTALSFSYQHDFQNSIISHYYNVDSFHLAVRHAIENRVIVSAFGHYENRRYDSSASFDPNMPLATTGPTRTDNATGAGLAADYYVKYWAYAGLGYNLVANSSNAAFVDATSGQTVSADFVKQQVFARVGLTY